VIEALLQLLLNGAASGGVYALVALGFGVVHNTMGIVNFTQVDFVSLGGMVLYSALFAAGLPMPAALAAAIFGSICRLMMFASAPYACAAAM
jgi:branched-chain amino acid transport system permease protein